MSDEPDYSHTCVACGYTGESHEFTDGSDVAEATGVLFCPECGHDDWGDE